MIEKEEKNIHNYISGITEKRTRSLIRSITEIKCLINLESLTRNFGKSGSFFYDIVRGKDDRKVNPLRIRKSIGVEYTFEEDLYGIEAWVEALNRIEKELIERIERKNRKGRTLTLKVKFRDFDQITRSKSSEEYLTREDIHNYMLLLAENIENKDKGARLLGLTISNLDTPVSEIIQLKIPFVFRVQDE